MDFTSTVKTVQVRWKKWREMGKVGDGGKEKG